MQAWRLVLGTCRILLAISGFVIFGLSVTSAEERQYTTGCVYDRPPNACRIDLELIMRRSLVGDREGQFLHAMHMYQNNSDKFMELLVESADNGYVWAQIVLGSLFALDLETVSDQSKMLLGMEYLEKAAKQKSWLAKALSGIAQHAYGNKFGSKKHFADGIKTVGRAVILREPVALAWAAQFYLTVWRRGIGRDQVATRRNLIGLLTATANVGWPEAAHELAMMYSTESKTRSDQFLALRWFRIAHLLGQDDALNEYWKFAARRSTDGGLLAHVRDDVAKWSRKRLDDRSSNFFHAQQWCDDEASDGANCPFRMASRHYDCSFIWLSIIPDYLGTQEYGSCMRRYHLKDGGGMRTIRSAIESIVPRAGW